MSFDQPMPACLFCGIAAHRVPSVILYEDADAVVFLDRTPVRPGHALVIPKKHCDCLNDADSDVLASTMRVVQTVGHALMQGLGAHGYHVQQNNGTAAGQTVPHLHFHVIPRFRGDGLVLWSGETYASDDERDSIAARIRGYFNNDPTAQV